MKKTFAVIVVLVLVTMCSAIEPALHNWRFMTEVDLLPYATGGYYLSGGLAGQHLRLRAVHSMVNIPSFATMEGFENYENTAFAVIADYFPGRYGTSKGLWIGSGVEYWQNSIRNKSDLSTKNFDQFVFTVGVGYVVPIGAHFFINPWCAGHLSLDGTHDIQVGDATAEIPGLMGEGSLKLGWRF